MLPTDFYTDSYRKVKSEQLYFLWLLQHGLRNDHNDHITQDTRNNIPFVTELQTVFFIKKVCFSIVAYNWSAHLFILIGVHLFKMD